MFSPPLAAETLLPGRDRACWEIAEYLKNAVNQDYQAIRDRLADPISGAEPAIVGIRDYNAWSNNFNDFPLLSVYRRGSSGEYVEICDATAAYYLPSLAMQDTVPGILRWVETRLVRNLHHLDARFRQGPLDARHSNLLLKNMRSEYGIGVLPQSEVSAFPFFRINFQFEEIGV
jgi:hypothetical protein